MRLAPQVKPVSLSARPIGLKAPPKLAATPKIPAPHAMTITKASNGGYAVQHHFGAGIDGPVTPGVSSPRHLIFTNSDKMFNHVKKAAAKMKAPVRAGIGRPLG